MLAEHLSDPFYHQSKQVVAKISPSLPTNPLANCPPVLTLHLLCRLVTYTGIVFHTQLYISKESMAIFRHQYTEEKLYMCYIVSSFDITWVTISTFIS